MKTIAPKKIQRAAAKIASTTNGDPRGDRRGDPRGELSRKLGLFTVLCIAIFLYMVRRRRVYAGRMEDGKRRQHIVIGNVSNRPF